MNTLKILIILMSIGLVIINSNSCKKEDTLPNLTTTAVSEVTGTTAQCGGNITSDGGKTIVARGVCWSTNINPAISDNKTIDGAGAGNFISNLISLNGGTNYYVKAYATNSSGTGYGMTISFKTLTVLYDIDGNIYDTITVGTQVWMAENLKTTKFKDGTTIPLVTDSSAWIALTTSAYCWYNNDAPTYKDTYGALYNWYSVKTNKLCPQGWHVPTDTEWTTLTTYLGGASVAGDKLKETGTTHWSSPNTGATNEVNFTALPGGNRILPDGSFAFIGHSVDWWTSTEHNTGYAWSRGISSGYTSIQRSASREFYGLSIRCIRD